MNRICRRIVWRPDGYAIIANTRRINHGQMPVYPQSPVQNVKETDFYLLPAKEPEQALSGG